MREGTLDDDDRGRNDGLVEIREVAEVMGTFVSAAAWARAERPAPVRAAIVRALAWLREVDDRFTTWRPGSEWLRFVEGDLALADAHPDLAFVIEQCDRLATETGGWFALDAVPGRPADPAAFVKGWAAQRAADLLVEAGAVKVCLNCGGDVVVWGGDRPWRVGIQSPFQHDELQGVIEIESGAVATSGLYERGRHLFDPRTGRPVEGWASVTVVGPDLGVADAYSTAAFVAGDAALTWLQRLQRTTTYSAYLIRPDGTTTSVGMALVDVEQ